jgi:hypothetical protein
MRKILAASLWLLLGAMLPAAAAGGNWTPDAQTIKRLEAAIHVPGGPGSRDLPVATYARYYAGVTLAGRRTIVGELVLPAIMGQKAGVHIGSEDDFPGIFDGGCDVVYLTYDVQRARIVSIMCNGIA